MYYKVISFTLTPNPDDKLSAVKLKFRQIISITLNEEEKRMNHNLGISKDETISKPKDPFYTALLFKFRKKQSLIHLLNGNSDMDGFASIRRQNKHQKPDLLSMFIPPSKE